jgi:uncharacterized protein
MEFDRFTITLLVLRDDAPEFTPKQEDALQDAHMSHLAGLHQAGHLLAAGPLLDRTSQFRGLSILNVSVEEARALKESDPAVQAGKFAVIALPWMVPAGAMSFSSTRFPGRHPKRSEVNAHSRVATTLAACGRLPSKQVSDRAAGGMRAWPGPV